MKYIFNIKGKNFLKEEKEKELCQKEPEVEIISTEGEHSLPSINIVSKIFNKNNLNKN